MDEGQSTGAGRPKKRVSFLMPYIDFCFMLIIIFIGMLSIAYFEPLGTTDIETQETREIDNLEGEFVIKPTGIQQQNIGLGQQEMSTELRPLEGSGQINALVAPGESGGAGDGGESTVAGPGGGRQLGRGDTPQAVSELQEQLRKKQAEIDRLKKEMSKMEKKKPGKNEKTASQADKDDEAAREQQVDKEPEEEPAQQRGDDAEATAPSPAGPETGGQNRGDHFYLDLRDKD